MSIKKNTIWNLFGSAAPMIIGFAAIPYIYKHIGIERVGILTIIWALIGYFSIFDFGLGRAITQRIARLSSVDGESEKIKAGTTGVFLTAMIGILGGLVCLVTIEMIGVSWINPAKSIQQETYLSFLLACLAIPATTTAAGLRGILEGEQQFKATNLLKLILGISNFVGPITAIYLFGPSLDFIVGSLVIVRYIILGAYFFIAKNKIGNRRNSFSFEESKFLFSYGGWVTLSNILSPLMVVADRFLIASFLGAAFVAYYTIPAEFMLRLLIIPAAITSTMFPVFSKSLAAGDFENTATLYFKSIKTIALLMGGVVTIIAIGAKSGIEIWLGSEFSEHSSAAASILALGILFNSIAQIPMAYIHAAGDARITVVFHIIEFILYFPALILFMHLFGIAGVAIAWTLRAALDLVLLYWRAEWVQKRRVVLLA